MTESIEGESGSRAQARVTFDARVYALPTIKKAAYRLLKHFDTQIDQDGDTWVCTLRFAGPTNGEAIERAERDLRIEVVDQDLRASIARETEPVRNAVLALAFSRTGLQGSEEV
jgi:His-Xaa-Ser system protein HxsD